MRVGSRRTSIASRHSVASIARPSSVFRHRGSSQIDLVQSPGSAVFALDGAEDESTVEHGAYRRHMPSRRDSRRWGRRDSNAQPGSYFSYRDYDRDQEDEDHISDEEEEFERQAVSPQKPSTTALGRIASFIGLTRHDAEDEEAAMGHPGDEHRRRSSSRSRSRRASSESRSYARSPSPSPSEQGWGYEDDDYMDSYGEGDEGYSSSLADDTSLPPQSRPTSPSIPLVPSATDGIFGEPNARPIDQDEPRDFVSVAVPSRQTIVLPDEDLSIRFTCYRTDPSRNVLWWLGCILTLGALGLLGRWMPTIWVKFLGRETSFEEAKEGSWLVVEVSGRVVIC